MKMNHKRVAPTLCPLQKKNIYVYIWMQAAGPCAEERGTGRQPKSSIKSYSRKWSFGFSIITALEWVNIVTEAIYQARGGRSLQRRRRCRREEWEPPRPIWVRTAHGRLLCYLCTAKKKTQKKHMKANSWEGLCASVFVLFSLYSGKLFSISLMVII